MDHKYWVYAWKWSIWWGSFQMDQKYMMIFAWEWFEFHRIFKISKILNFIRVNVHFKPCSYQVSFRVGADRFPASNIPSWSKFSQCRLFISRTYLTSDPNRQYRSSFLGFRSRTRFRVACGPKGRTPFSFAPKRCRIKFWVWLWSSKIQKSHVILRRRRGKCIYRKFLAFNRLLSKITCFLEFLTGTIRFRI